MTIEAGNDQNQEGVTTEKQQSEQKDVAQQTQDVISDGDGDDENSKPFVCQPIILKRAVSGTVKWFNIQKGYGFISVDDSDEELFVHASSIIRSVKRPLVLTDSQKVEFNIMAGAKGPEAVSVSGPNGMRVGKVIDFNHPYFSYYRNRNNVVQTGKTSNNGPPQPRQHGQEDRSVEGKDDDDDDEAIKKKEKDIGGEKALTVDKSNGKGSQKHHRRRMRRQQAKKNQKEVEKNGQEEEVEVQNGKEEVEVQNGKEEVEVQNGKDGKD